MKNKYLINYSIILFCIGLIFVFFESCKKNDPEPSPESLKIVSISKANLTYTDTLSVKFNKSIKYSGINIFLGDSAISLLSTNDSELKFIVPYKIPLGSYSLKLKINNDTIKYSSQIQIALTNAPIIHGFSPKSFLVPGYITITGEYFAAQKNGNNLNGLPGSIISASQNVIVYNVTGIFNDKIKLSIGENTTNYAITSDTLITAEDYYVLPKNEFFQGEQFAIVHNSTKATNIFYFNNATVTPSWAWGLGGNPPETQRGLIVPGDAPLGKVRFSGVFGGFYGMNKNGIKSDTILIKKNPAIFTLSNSVISKGQTLTLTVAGDPYPIHNDSNGARYILALDNNEFGIDVSYNTADVNGTGIYSIIVPTTLTSGIKQVSLKLRPFRYSNSTDIEYSYTLGSNKLIVN